MTHDDTRLARPFEVAYDTEDGEYYIFAPPGCVLVDGHEVEIADADANSHTVALDCLDPDDMPDALYAHVTQDASSTGGYKVEFDGEEAKEGALFNFRVCRFGLSENDGNQYDICASCVTLGVHMLHPYEVRWSQGENDGEGAWVIWLPDISKVVMVGGEYVTPTGISAATNEPAGWYTIDGLLKTDQAIWLVVTVPTEESSSTILSARFDKQKSSADNAISVLVATMEIESSTDIKLVKQFVNSAITLGGSGSDTITPDDKSTEIDSENETLQIKDWATGTNNETEERTHSLGEILAGASDNSASTNGEKMMLRPAPAQGQIPGLAYRTVGTIPFDGSSIEGFNNGSARKVQIKGFDSAQAGQVPVKKNGSIVWETPSGGGQSIDLSDFANGIYFLTGIEWDTTNYQIKANRVLVKFANDKLSVTDAGNQTINTTPWTSAGTTTPT